MKTLFLFLLTTLPLLAACGGEPFGPELFTQSGPGEAGHVGLSPGAAGATDGDGAAGAPDGVNAGGAAGETPVSAGGAGPSAAGSPSAAGTGGIGGTAGLSGAGGAVTPPAPAPPCSPATIVTGKNHQDLGVIGWCLKTSADVNYFGCSHWDDREIRLNGHAFGCWIKFPPPPAIDGYNYIEVAPGPGDMASIDWSVT